MENKEYSFYKKSTKKTRFTFWMDTITAFLFVVCVLLMLALFGYHFPRFTASILSFIFFSYVFSRARGFFREKSPDDK